MIGDLSRHFEANRRMLSDLADAARYYLRWTINRGSSQLSNVMTGLEQ